MHGRRGDAQSSGVGPACMHCLGAGSGDLFGARYKGGLDVGCPRLVLNQLGPAQNARSHPPRHRGAWYVSPNNHKDLEHTSPLTPPAAAGTTEPTHIRLTRALSLEARQGLNNLIPASCADQCTTLTTAYAGCHNSDAAVCSSMCGDKFAEVQSCVDCAVAAGAFDAARGASIVSSLQGACGGSSGGSSGSSSGASAGASASASASAGGASAAPSAGASSAARPSASASGAPAGSGSAAPSAASASASSSAARPSGAASSSAASGSAAAASSSAARPSGSASASASASAPASAGFVSAPVSAFAVLAATLLAAAAF